MSQTSLHIVFGESAGGALRQAMAQSGFSEEIIAFPDDLSFGPINPPDPTRRIAWMKRELSCSRTHERLADDTEKFWTYALSTPARRIIWASKRSACDYTGLLECIWRFDETSHVIDLTDVKSERESILTLGELHPRQISEKALWTCATEISAAARQRYRESWRKLRGENAPFRVVENLQLISAPITVYDDLLVGNVAHEWVKSAEVIGNALGERERSAQRRRAIWPATAADRGRTA
jgi:hypothetical protein